MGPGQDGTESNYESYVCLSVLCGQVQTCPVQQGSEVAHERVHVCVG